MRQTIDQALLICHLVAGDGLTQVNQTSDHSAWLRDRLVARPRGDAPMRANWAEVCDGFFFTDVMFPSTLWRPAESTASRDGEDVD